MHTVGGGFDYIGQVDLRGMLWLDDAHVQVGQVAGLVVQAAARETQDDIREALLGLDIEVAVASPISNLLAHLLHGISTRGAIANDLPLLQERILRVEIDAHVSQLTQFRCKKRVQAVNNHDLAGMNLFWRAESAGCMIIDRLENRLSTGETLEVLGHQGQIVSIRVQRANAST